MPRVLRIALGCRAAIGLGPGEKRMTPDGVIKKILEVAPIPGEHQESK